MDEKDKLIQELRTELHDSRNELCYKCGRCHDDYKTGACNGCRWASDGRWKTL